MIRAGRPWALGTCLALGGLLSLGAAPAQAQVRGSVSRSASGIGAQGTDGRTNPSEWGTVLSAPRTVAAAPARVAAPAVRGVSYANAAQARRGFFRPQPVSTRRNYSNGADGVSPRAAHP